MFRCMWRKQNLNFCINNVQSNSQYCIYGNFEVSISYVQFPFLGSQVCVGAKCVAQMSYISYFRNHLALWIKYCVTWSSSKSVRCILVGSFIWFVIFSRFIIFVFFLFWFFSISFVIAILCLATHFFFPFHAAVLEPRFNLRLIESQSLSKFCSVRRIQIFLLWESFLEYPQLQVSKNSPRLTAFSSTRGP